MSNVDYELAFKKFLDVDTWHTTHPLDDRRFYICLHHVVDNDNFSPESMGDYMRYEKKIDSETHHHARRIDSLVEKASAVYDYVRAVHETSAYEDPDVVV